MLNKLNTLCQKIISENEQDNNIHIRLKTVDNNYFWLHYDPIDESYLVEGESIFGEDNYGNSYLRGTGFKNLDDAKKHSKDAKYLAGANNLGRCSISYWTVVDGDQVKVKI